MVKRFKKIPKFFKEVREELKNINWPSRKELTTASVIVFIVSGLMTSYIFAVDLGLSKLMQLVLR